ncbi:MAG: prepilin-type N-terminal cleavage/methylation domain-containing protein [Prosthecobacter sp.]|uniref:type IV pilus modification PilV family protein n=1 Tax=Prosthecobacter sp. TaxID=1965333 RepID=UPI003901DDE9
MKLHTHRSLTWFAMVCDGLRWFGKPRPTTANNRKQPQTARSASRGYTLIEVLAAGAIISIGTTAMVSLSATLMLQEELSARVAITRNHQENMVRLWQLGLSTVQITALMPAQAQNAVLQQAIFGTPTLIESGLTTANGVVMETALCTTVVNSSQNPATETAGASFTLTAYRPRLITDLRPLPP